MRVFDCDVLANNKDWLVEQYVINNLSMREIAFICDVSADSIRTRLNRFGVQIRDRKGANKLAYNKGVPKTITPELKKAQENKKTGNKIECIVCGKIVYRTKSRLENSKFCSVTCRDVYLRENANRNQFWRDYPEYKEWRKLVYARDSWKCKICGSKKNINAHHIYAGADNNKLRFDIGNGITLCEKHHIQLHKYTSSFIQECIKQTPNIGGTPEVDNPEAQIRKYLFFLIGSNDYQGESRTDYGIVWTATITNEIAEIGGNDLSHESE